MPIETQGGEVFDTAKTAGVSIAPRIAVKLAHAHRDEVLRAFTAQPGRNAETRKDMKRRRLPPSVGPSNRTFRLHDSMKVQKVKGKNHGAKIIALYYWRFVMEFGSWLRSKKRRIDPQFLVSTASEKVWQDRDKIIDTELHLYTVRVTGTSTGGA